MNYKKEALDLSNKNLIEFPKEAFEFKKLRKLYLRNNEIKILPREISKLQYLETLDIGGNEIGSLFAKIFELKNLRILILGNNQINNIPKQVSQLSNLKILSLKGNKLTSLPKEINQLKKLEELNISDNNFEDFPRAILELKTLKSLWLSNNNFKTFPFDEIRDSLPHLKHLYCYSFQIEEPESDIAWSFIALSKIKGNCLNYLSKLESGNLQTHPQANLELQPMQKNKIFISYSHADKPWLEKIKKHLKVLKFEGLNFDYWDDTRIKTGDRWKEEIKRALDESYIAILLVSTDFLASDFINTDELPPLLKLAEDRGTRILPLLTSPSRFTKNTGLSKFQSVNDPNKTLNECSLPEQDRVLIKLTEDIEDFISSQIS